MFLIFPLRHQFSHVHGAEILVDFEPYPILIPAELR